MGLESIGKTYESSVIIENCAKRIWRRLLG